MSQKDYIEKVIADFKEVAPKYNVGAKATLFLSDFICSALEKQVEEIKERLVHIETFSHQCDNFHLRFDEPFVRKSEVIHLLDL